MRKSINTAQQILSALGVPVGQTIKQAHGNKNPSASAFGIHTASSARKERRQLVAAHGRRQALKMIKFWRAETKAANDERTDGASSRHYEQPELA